MLGKNDDEKPLSEGKVMESEPVSSQNKSVDVNEISSMKSYLKRDIDEFIEFINTRSQEDKSVLFRYPIIDLSNDKKKIKDAIHTSVDAEFEEEKYKDLLDKKNIGDYVKTIVNNELVKRIQGNPTSQDKKIMNGLLSGTESSSNKFNSLFDGSQDKMMAVERSYNAVLERQKNIDSGKLESIPDGSANSEGAVINLQYNTDIFDEKMRDDLEKELESARKMKPDIENLIEKAGSMRGGSSVPKSSQAIESKEVVSQSPDSLDSTEPSGSVELPVSNLEDIRLPTNTPVSIKELIKDVKDLKKMIDKKKSSNVLDILKLKGVRRLSAVASVVSVGELVAFTGMALIDDNGMNQKRAITSAALAIPSVLLFAAREIYKYKKDTDEFESMKKDLNDKQMELFELIKFISGGSNMINKLKEEKPTGDMPRAMSEPLPEKEIMGEPSEPKADSYPLTSSEKKKITKNIAIQRINVEPSVSYLNVCISELMEEYRITVQDWSTRQNSIPLDDFIQTYPKLSLAISKVCIVLELIPPISGHIVKETAIFLIKTMHEVLYQLGLYKWVVGLSAVYLTRHQILFPLSLELGQRGVIYILNTTLLERVKTWGLARVTDWAEKLAADVAQKTAAAAAAAAAEAAAQATSQAAQQAAKDQVQKQIQNKIFESLVDPENIKLLTQGAQFAGETLLTLTAGTGGGLIADLFKVTKKRRRRRTKKRSKKSKKKTKQRKKTKRTKKSKSKRKRKRN